MSNPLGKVFQQGTAPDEKASGPPIVSGSAPHAMLNLEAKNGRTIWRGVTHLGNRPSQGAKRLARVSTLLLLRPAGNTVIFWLL